MADVAQAIKDGLTADSSWWPAGVSTVTPTLHIDDDWQPSDESPQVLVADDGGPRMYGGPWAGRRAHRKPLLRFTGFAKGRSRALGVVGDAVDWTVEHKKDVGITRVDDVSDPLVTRDRATGAYLASILVPAIVRPS